MDTEPDTTRGEVDDQHKTREFASDRDERRAFCMDVETDAS